MRWQPRPREQEQEQSSEHRGRLAILSGQQQYQYQQCKQRQHGSHNSILGLSIRTNRSLSGSGVSSDTDHGRDGDFQIYYFSEDDTGAGREQWQQQSGRSCTRYGSLVVTILLHTIVHNRIVIFEIIIIISRRSNHAAHKQTHEQTNKQINRDRCYVDQFSWLVYMQS